MQMCLISCAFIYRISFKIKKCLRMFFLGGGGRSCTAVFCENLVAICTHDMRLWIWIGIWMGNSISTASLFLKPGNL